MCYSFMTLFNKSGAEDLQRRHPSVESDESLGYHWGSWLGDGIQPLDGLTAGDEANSLELSLLLSFAGESAASSPSVEPRVYTMFNKLCRLLFFLLFTEFFLTVQHSLKGMGEDITLRLMLLHYKYLHLTLCIMSHKMPAHRTEAQASTIVS